MNFKTKYFWGVSSLLGVFLLVSLALLQSPNQAQASEKQVSRVSSANIRDILERSSRPSLDTKPSGSQRIRSHHDSLQPKREDIPHLSTKALLDEITSTPLFVVITLESFPDGGLSKFAETHYCVDAFLGRPDACTVLLKEYKEQTNNIFNRAKEPRFTFRFAIMEILMSSQQIREQFKSDAKSPKIIPLILDSLAERKKYDALQPEPVYGEATMVYSSMALAKYMNDSGVPGYKKWLAEKAPGLFTERPVTYREAKEILNIATNVSR